MTKPFSIVLLFFTLFGCKNSTQMPVLESHEINKVIDRMTNIMVHDITNPPLAARFYAYVCLTGYEVVAQHDTAFHTMKGVLNDYPTIEKPNVSSDYS